MPAQNHSISVPVAASQQHASAVQDLMVLKDVSGLWHTSVINIHADEGGNLVAQNTQGSPKQPFTRPLTCLSCM